MKTKPSLFIACVLVIATAVSCIKGEAPNAEADIETAHIANAAELLEGQPIIKNKRVIFRLKKTPDSFDFSPDFTLTPGATMVPTSGTERDFSQAQLYVVTSEDGNWSKTYKVSFVVYDEHNYNFSFENAEVVNTENPEGHYDRFFHYLANGEKVYDWASGNPGFNILAYSLLDEGEELTPEFYPTWQTADGYIGKGVEMETRDTGPLGEVMNSPLAAGNFFVGNFVLTFPSIKSPRFGQPYNLDQPPVALKGYYKYKAGDDFEVNTGTSDLTHDRWDAYAILFEKRDEDNYLSGDHDFEDPRMVAVARLPEDQYVEASEWTAFDIPFHYVNGKSFDPDKAYMYTIVFTSSVEGGNFNGAVGSTLWIDEVHLVAQDGTN